MERKDLDKINNYLPVIVATCDRYGWCGGRGIPISELAAPEVRTFFEFLQPHVPLNQIPDLEDIEGSIDGGIRLLWETEVNPVDVTYDSFAITFRGEEMIDYEGTLESIGMSTSGCIPLEPELHSDIIEHIKFFKRRQDEQREIQKSTAFKSNSN